jgi:hypothetical protein
MEPTNPTFGSSNEPARTPFNEGIEDIDRAFDEMATAPEPATPSKLRDYLDQAQRFAAAHRILTAAIGLGFGFTLGRLLRRS